MLLLVVLGVPFSWPKFRGGHEVDWVGYWLDYKNFEVGLSEARAHWIMKWLLAKLVEGMILIKEFREGLGRLGFASGAIENWRPFLGPMYAWASVLPDYSFVQIPVMIQIIMKYLIEEIQQGHYKEAVALDQSEEEAFRADAKAEQETVGLGGWETRGDKRPSQARWFSIFLTKKNAPWVFEGGEPYTKIATLELLATMISVIAFPPVEEDKCTNEVLTFSAATDNLGNRHAVSKLMTTKFPLCAAMMQLSSTLTARKQKLKLNWAPREQNYEADELSNGITRRFDPEKEVKVEPILEKLVIFNKMIKFGRSLYEDIKTKKEESRAKGDKKEKREDKKDSRIRESNRLNINRFEDQGGTAGRSPELSLIPNEN